MLPVQKRENAIENVRFPVTTETDKAVETSGMKKI